MSAPPMLSTATACADLSTGGGAVSADDCAAVHDWRMDENHFRLDGLEPTWEAVRFGEPWNGWLTPVTTRETLASLLEVLGDGFRWDGDTAVVWPTIDLVDGEPHDPGTEDRIAPDGDGTYDLGVLGWTFTRA